MLRDYKLRIAPNLFGSGSSPVNVVNTEIKLLLLS
jgi:hypothetical protein